MPAPTDWEQLRTATSTALRTPPRADAPTLCQTPHLDIQDPYTAFPEYTGEPEPADAAASAVAVPSSLDSLETSENPPTGVKDQNTGEFRRNFEKFMNEHGEPSQLFAPAAYDDRSLSANFRHSGWMPIRRRVYESMQRCSVTNSRRAAFGQCGSYSWVERSTAHPDRFRVRHNHCNDRLCTPCANARSRKLRISVQEIIADRPVSFITLTLCGHGEPLAVMLDRLYKHFKALRNHPTWADAVAGGVAFLEVKYSDKAQRWHPHLHILCDAKFIPQDDLRRAWFSISHDSFIVDIQRVASAEQVGNYVTKYASKPLNTSFANSPALLDEALKSLKGRRLCFAFGTWYGKALVDPDLDGDDALDLVQEGWAFFDQLETLLHRANGGSPEARHIFLTMNAEAQWRSTLNLPPPDAPA